MPLAGSSELTAFRQVPALLRQTVPLTHGRQEHLAPAPSPALSTVPRSVFPCPCPRRRAPPPWAGAEGLPCTFTLEVNPRNPPSRLPPRSRAGHAQCGFSTAEALETTASAHHGASLCRCCSSVRKVRRRTCPEVGGRGGTAPGLCRPPKVLFIAVSRSWRHQSRAPI